MSKESYLGEGLFASYDGFQFKLRAPREFGDHEVFLEPVVLRSFLEYVVQHGGRLFILGVLGPEPDLTPEKEPF